MRKAPYMKMKDYMACVEELNNYLSMFPDYTIGDELHKDELLGIYEYGIPKTWSKHFLLQNWVPQHHTKQEFREFCERLKMAIDITPRAFVKSKDYNGPRGRFCSIMSKQYKDTRATTLRPSGFKPAQTFQSTRNNAPMNKRC
jgi:hypothetical protein